MERARRTIINFYAKLGILPKEKYPEGRPIYGFTRTKEY